MPVLRPSWPALATLFLPVAAAAQQVVPIPTPTPEPTAVAPPIVPPIVIATPTPVPTSAPSPAATATPTRVQRSRPVATPTVEATVAPTPTPTPTPSVMRTPRAPQAPAPIPSPTPIPTPTMPVVVLPSPDAAGAAATPTWLPWVVALAGLALLGAGWAALRGRGEPTEPEVEAAPDFAEPVPVAIAAALSFELRPTRAGLNLISATVEAEVAVTNDGAAPATDVRADVRLLSAHAGQDDDLARFHADGPIRPATPPFTLAPGATHRFRVTAALAHAAIRPLDAAGRPIFVPLLALAARFGDEAGERRVGQAWVVGIERVDSPKLQPFRLDAPARAYENVAARPQGPAMGG